MRKYLVIMVLLALTTIMGCNSGGDPRLNSSREESGLRSSREELRAQLKGIIAKQHIKNEVEKVEDLGKLISETDYVWFGTDKVYKKEYEDKWVFTYFGPSYIDGQTSTIYK